MDDHPDADDIVKVEMQDVYPSSRQQAELNALEDHSPISSTSRHLMDSSRGSHYDHVASINDQNSISVEQRAAAIMDRIKQVCKLLSMPFSNYVKQLNRKHLVYAFLTGAYQFSLYLHIENTSKLPSVLL